jgi:hypothetical protein
MIIKIDWPHDVIDSIPAINLVEILTRLVISDAYGHNLVVISRGLAEAFLSRLSLGEYVSANLRTIKEQYAERGSYVTGDRFPILNVTRDQDRKLEKLSDRNFQIGYKELLGSRLLDKPILLLEGPKSDGIVFDAIINSILKFNKIGKLSYEKRSGGGDTTLEVLKGLIADRHVIACICDSDRLTPTCSLGGTANKIQKNLHLLPTAILTFLVTPTREVENFVPFEVARHLIVDPHDKPKIVKLGHLIDAQGIVGIEDCIWSFYDIKKGIDAKKLPNPLGVRILNSGL